MKSPIVRVWRRIVDAAIRTAREEGVAWWDPDDEQAATLRTEGDWLIASIGGWELLRMRRETLERLAADEPRQN